MHLKGVVDLLFPICEITVTTGKRKKLVDLLLFLQVSFSRVSIFDIHPSQHCSILRVWCPWVRMCILKQVEAVQCLEDQTPGQVKAPENQILSRFKMWTSGEPDPKQVEFPRSPATDGSPSRLKQVDLRRKIYWAGLAPRTPSYLTEVGHSQGLQWLVLGGIFFP